MARDTLPSNSALVSRYDKVGGLCCFKRSGFIETGTGKGSFVTEGNQDFLREKLLRHFQEYMSKRLEQSLLLSNKRGSTCFP